MGRERAFRAECAVILIKLIKKDLHKDMKLIIIRGVQAMPFIYSKMRLGTFYRFTTTC